jgi:hypothetical protein
MASAPARRLAYEHNSELVHSGVIYLVDLATGEIGEPVATYAATQVAEGHKLFGTHALLRIGHGRLSQKEAQRFIDEKGKGW